MDGSELCEDWGAFYRRTETLGEKSHPASADQELDFLRSEQVLEWRLVGDHMEASPERFELLLHAFVQHVLGVLCNELLHRKHISW